MTSPVLGAAAGLLLAYVCDFGAFGRMRNIMSQKSGRGDEWAAVHSYNPLATHRVLSAIACGALAYYGIQGDMVLNRAAFIAAVICSYLMIMFSYSQLIRR